MNYIIEARRLGVPIPMNPDFVMGDFFDNATPTPREDGLCVSGCDICRGFRNDVRAAQAKHRAAVISELRNAAKYSEEDMDGAFRAGFKEGVYAAEGLHEVVAYELQGGFRKLRDIDPLAKPNA